MIRVVKMGGKWCGLDIGPYITSEEREDIEMFVNEGEPVLLCYDLETAQYTLDDADIEMVE